MAAGLTLPLLLVCAAGVGASQRKDQDFITIHPQRLVLTESKVAGQVRVTCRQLPISAAAQPTLLSLSRKLQHVRDGAFAGEESMFAFQRNEILHRGAKQPGKYHVTGNIWSRLVVTFLRATCLDATYTYICRAELSTGDKNSASAVFKAEIEEPTISLLAKPNKGEYAKTDRLTLSCGTKQAVALSTERPSPGRWMWEYNDVGYWIPALAKHWSQKPNSTLKCFVRIGRTELQVKVADLVTCSRRFRCYILRGGARQGVDNSKEFSVRQTFQACSDRVKVIGADPFVAIVIVLAFIAATVLAAYYLFRFLQGRRWEADAERQKQIDHRILSPMTAEERDAFLDEKLKKKAEQDQLQPSNPQQPAPEDEGGGEKKKEKGEGSVVVVEDVERKPAGDDETKNPEEESAAEDEMSEEGSAAAASSPSPEASPAASGLSATESESTDASEV